MSGVLESHGLTVRYAGNVALSDIDIGVPAGTMVDLEALILPGLPPISASHRA